MSQSDWVPYGGFIISSNSIERKSTKEATINSKETGLRTKIIFGTRYFFFKGLALNSFVILSYESDAQQASQDNKTGGTISKLSAELNLFTLSIFF